MLRVYHRSESFHIILPCYICGEKLLLAETWLAFPSQGETVEAVFVHRPCLDGRLRQLFQQDRVTLMRGSTALVRMAESLQGPIWVEE